MPQTDYFTGSGATGVPIQEAADLGAQLDFISTIGTDYGWQAVKAKAGYGEMPDWCGDPNSPIRHYCNPGVHNSKSYSDYYLGLSESTRDSQATTLLTQDIVRPNLTQVKLERTPESRFTSPSMKTEIVDAPTKTRAEYMKTVGNRYDLDPEVIAAVILTEQRDQSEAEDIADYYGAAVLERTVTSIGLGQISLNAAEPHDLLGDIFPNYSYSIIPDVARLLADEAININATAKYLRLIADAGAEIENQNTNSLHANDSLCGEPNNGTYTNDALRDLSVLSQHSSNWTSDQDPEIAGMQTPPSPITNIQSNNQMSLPSGMWEYARDHYYVGLLAEEYTTCPLEEVRERTFDSGGQITYPDQNGPQSITVSAGDTKKLPGVLKFGISVFQQQNNNWVYRSDIQSALSGWRLWAAQAFADCQRVNVF